MSGYLDGYGQSDARREKVIKKIVLVAALVLSLAGILYFQFRDWREERILNEFRTLLSEEKYREAYTLWGCTTEEPCPQYPFEKFLEDWGPHSQYGDVAKVDVERTRSCESGIIQVWEFFENDRVPLYVDRGDGVISFAPWETCNPRYSPAQLEGR